MNKRERVRKSIRHIEPDRLPRYDSFWEDTLTKWHQQGETAEGLELQDKFGFDIVQFYLDNSFRLEPEMLKNDGKMITVRDRCGYTAEKFIGKSRTLHMYDHVTKDLESWKLLKKRLRVDIDEFSRVDSNPFFMRCDPSPTWSEAAARFRNVYDTGKYVMMNSYGPFEAAWRHRGFTELLMDTATDEAFINDIFWAHTNLIIETLSKCLDLGIKPDGFFLIEDLGHTGGLLISPDVYRRTISPCHRKLGDFLHSRDIDFIMHSCGKVKELIPDFISEGLDVLQALEAKADQNVAVLKHEYGKDLAFMGNIDVMKLAGTVSDIEEEIQGKIIPAMKGGGYIYHSDHSIPPEVSLGNYRYLMKRLDDLTY